MWLDKTCAEKMRLEIKQAAGNEVFFVLSLDASGNSQVKVMARGNKNSVPAVVRPQMGQRIYVIHNHPSGDLTPSGADITVAARLSREGVGFAIVNNDVTDSYVVVEPIDSNHEEQISQDTVQEILGRGGRIARILTGFETREPQMKMATGLLEALNTKQHALAEAGTGTGKSLAYLVPSLLWAMQNGKRVVISTNTINLQEQLLFKDIPLLKKAMTQEFNAVLVKGRGNYLCRRKFIETKEQGEELLEDNLIDDFRTLVDWEAGTHEGSKSDMGFNPAHALWEQVSSETDTCMRFDCPEYNSCYFHLARKLAVNAQLLIVNHSLLFADIALRALGADTGVLPEYHCIVFDEAHNVENAATKWLGASVTKLAFTRQFSRLWSGQHGRRAKGILPVVQTKVMALPGIGDGLASGLLDTISGQLTPGLMGLTESVNGMFSGFESCLEGISKVRLTQDFVQGALWKRQLVTADDVLKKLRSFTRELDSFINRIENLGPKEFEHLLQQVVEMSAVKKRLEALESELREIIYGDSDETVRWVDVERGRRGNKLVFNHAPVSVNDILREYVWDKYPTVIFTSATLTVDKKFDYFRERLGLAKDGVLEMQLESPFNYQKNVLVGVPVDMPSPEDRRFTNHVAAAVRDSALGSKGRALVLFTSFSMLKATAEMIREPLTRGGINLLCQGELPRNTLLEQFRADTGSVLLATASFWEGVDVAGESLSNLILTRLPFTVPDEPVVQARMEDLEKRGHNPFYSYQVPQAVLRFKQGFGRLIRTGQDRGVVLILDKRVLTKSYGRIFLNSLPSTPVIQRPLTEILPQHGQFLINK